MIARIAEFIPDGDEARRRAVEELSDPRYAQARPTWFDRMSQSVYDFITGLFSSDQGTGLGPVALVVVCAIVVAALVALLVVWGRPRTAATGRRRGPELLGADDDRSAAQLRAEAERSARAGDHRTATVLRFRALARGLIERDLIDPAPGATAQAIARDAGRVFVDEAGALRDAAGLFDDVRYLEHAPAAQRYQDLVALDDRLEARRPAEITA